MYYLVLMLCYKRMGYLVLIPQEKIIQPLFTEAI